ncbi:rhomboid family intramembrane serine protease [Labrys neptuniae]
MDLQTFLGVSAGSLSAVIIAQTFVTGAYRFPGSLRYLLAHAVVIAIAVAGFWLLPDYYGFLAAIALIAILVPGPLMNRANRELLAGHNERAAWFARAAALLHPTGQIRFTAKLFGALAEPTREARIAALERLRSGTMAGQDVVLELQVLRQKHDWQGIVDYLKRHPVPPGPDAIVFPIRALGETGQLEAMVATGARNRALFGSGDLSTLVLLAFSGRVTATDALVAARHDMPAWIKAFWQATALQAAGRGELAEPLLRGFAAATLAPAQREMLTARLDRPAQQAEGRLSLEAVAFLDTLETHVQRNVPLQRAGWRTAPLTYLLVLANCAMFGVEMLLGDSTSTENLFRLGGLWPNSVIADHEWWRLISAMFLHAGPEHLISNMLGLFLLGRMLENAIGSLRFGVIYLAGGLISMGGVFALMQAGIVEPDLLVGASGAIFALIGAIALRRLADFLATRHIADRQSLSLIAIVLVIQATIDLSLPQISFSAHGIGFVAGIALAWLLGLARASRR